MFFSVNNKKKICFSGKLDCPNKGVVVTPATHSVLTRRIGEEKNAFFNMSVMTWNDK